jgi:ribosomal protein L28
MVATKRRFDPNLQRVRIVVDGAPRRAYVCTRCLKSGKVTKAQQPLGPPRGLTSRGDVSLGNP